MSYEKYSIIRAFAAVAFVALGLFSMLIVAYNWPVEAASNRKLFIIAWSLIPPILIFIERWLFASARITCNDQKCDERTMQDVKDFADLASKIWLAIVFSLNFLVANP